MLTLFTLPKPFVGHINIIQRNAIKSWKLLRPQCEIILFGDEEGTADCAKEFDVRHVHEVVKNEFGTPLLNTAFSYAQKIANHPFLCYLNADIILMKDFLLATQCIHLRNFMMVGQKWNLNLMEQLDFSLEDWEGMLIRRVQIEGKFGEGFDYFLFPKNWGTIDMPPFAVGRPLWDNWIIFRARQMKMPVIDVSQITMVIHQNHGYNHVPQQRGEEWEGPEADRHRQLLGDLHRKFTLLDATHVMKKSGLKRNLTYSHIKRRLQTLGVLYPLFSPYARAISKILNLGRKYVKSMVRFLTGS